MASPVRTIVHGVMTATAIAVILVVASAGSANTWKYLLAAIGLALFVLSGLGRDEDSD